MNDFVMHYGTPRHSGRYPWGSGDNPYQRSKTFRAHVADMRKTGMSDTQIAKAMDMTTSQFRAKMHISKTEIRSEEARQARRLKDKGYSNIAIGKKLGKSESTVRSLLDEERQARNDVTTNTANALKERVDAMGAIDVGAGSERLLGVTRTAMKNSLAILEEQGYSVKNMQIDQLGTNHKTTMQVLIPPGADYRDLYDHLDDVKMVKDIHTEDGGKTWYHLEPPQSISSKRVMVKYAEDGGKEKDGVIELRPGVADISLGNARYAQVRIAVDGTHYLKGMAVYADDLPDGIDVRFNTNKTKDIPMISNSGDSVLKKMKSDTDNPFGATIKGEDDVILTQRHYTDADGNTHLSAINVVNEEGDWRGWSRTISSQVLSKQSVELAKEQLGKSLDRYRAEYESISELDNPVVKKKFLMDFSEDCDAAAVHLKAAALPRQTNSVILPVPELADNEVYAPNYKNGERVVLIRHPHAGTFEIPELIVNNNNKAAEKLIGQAPDAIGINSKVAERLSGADFDGDTVLVIPNNSKRIQTSKPLDGLVDFDPKIEYKARPGMEPMSDDYKQIQMGIVSNLITDMTIKGAPQEDLVRAVRHSMVVIDAVKHNLDWKASETENGIAALKQKYQGDPDTGKEGAATLISRSKSKVYPLDRKQYYDIDPETGEKLYKYTGETYLDKNGNVVERRSKVPSTRMAETNDAYTLSSGRPMENVYAEYANALKQLANEARKEYKATENPTVSSAAKQTFAPEVASLTAKLNEALKNAPYERMAQRVANARLKMKLEANPEMDKEHRRKIRYQLLAQAREEVGANKKDKLVKITPREWAAIQAHAVSTSTLEKILNNTDPDAVRKLASPRRQRGLTSSQASRAKAMLNNGHTQAEVAEALGVSVDTILDAIR